MLLGYQALMIDVMHFLNNAPVAQPAEATVSKAVQCQFESDREHHMAQYPNLAEETVLETV